MLRRFDKRSFEHGSRGEVTFGKDPQGVLAKLSCPLEETRIGHGINSAVSIASIIRCRYFSGHSRLKSLSCGGATHRLLHACIPPCSCMHTKTLDNRLRFYYTFHHPSDNVRTRNTRSTRTLAWFVFNPTPIQWERRWADENILPQTFSLVLCPEDFFVQHLDMLEKEVQIGVRGGSSPVVVRRESYGTDWHVSGVRMLRSHLNYDIQVFARNGCLGECRIWKGNRAPTALFRTHVRRVK